MERIDWKKHFRWHILALKVCGLWPENNESYGLNLYTLYMILSSVFFQVTFVCFQTVNLYYINDLQVLTGTIFILITGYAVCLKTYSLVRNITQLKYLMLTVNKDIFQPKNERQKQLVLPNIKLWKINVMVFWSSCCVCVILMALFPILDKSYEDHRLPFFSWYPFDTNISPQYEFTYVYQIATVCFVAVVNITVDNMVAYFNMYVGSQFDILCDKLKSINDGVKDTWTEINKKFIECIIHHKEIVKFASCANGFYNELLFVQFFSSGITIGIAMFQLTIVVSFSSEFHYLVTYTSAILSEIFIYCWFGNAVEVKSRRVPYAIFQSNWTDLPPSIKKNIIIFVIRTQKPLTISAFSLFTLSLDTFVRILRTSWSYFALLRQVNQLAN